MRLVTTHHVSIACWSYLRIGVSCVPLHQLTERIRVLRAEQVHEDEHPVVQQGCVLSQEPVKPQLVTSQGLHDLQERARKRPHKHTPAEIEPAHSDTAARAQLAEVTQRVAAAAP